MKFRYNCIPVALLAVYALCAVCPERLLPALAAQATEANETHDCHGGKTTTESDCRTAIFQSLPPPTAELVYSVSSQAVLPSHLGSALACELSLRRRGLHFSTAGPPIAPLKPNLRI